jgi:hypothetical protein
MPSYQTTLRLFVVSLIAGLALACVLNAAAQSGRQSKKTPPAPIPAAAEEPTPAREVEKPKPALTFIVGMERYDGFGPHVTSPGTILMSVSDRLDDNPTVEVEQVRGDLNRTEAIRRAKAEKEAYVVLLELETESTTAVSIKFNEITIQYSVFSPTTAKVKAFGRTYPQVARSKGVIVNPGRNGIYSDYQLQQAGRHAAEKILKAFKLQLANSGLSARKD